MDDLTLSLHMENLLMLRHAFTLKRAFTCLATLLIFSTTASLASIYDNELLTLTNAERQKYNLAPLTLSSQLGQAAQGHADDMANNNYFSHTGLNGSSVSDRVRATGYSYRSVGENIAAGQRTPSEVVQGWMNSPGHRANILNSGYTQIGFGYSNQGSSTYGTYWVQVFGTPSGTSTDTGTGTGTDTGTGTGNVLTSGVATTGSLAYYTYQEYTITAQANQTELSIDLYNLSADLDLYVKKGQSVLSSSELDCISEAFGTTAENCTLENNTDTTWYIMVLAYEAGSYSLKASLSDATNTSTSTARLVNISTRAFVGEGMENKIAGFAVSGTGTKKLVVRSIGQGLGAAGVDTKLNAQFNVVTFPARNAVSNNSSWGTGRNATLLQSLNLAPGHSSDAADVLDFSAGAYTTEVSPESPACLISPCLPGDSGIGLIEVFEAPNASSDSRLSNISTRAFVGSGLQNLIAGFAIAGEGKLKLVLRSLGQGLAAAGVATNLDARIQLYTYPDRQLLATNDSWGSGSSASELQSLNLAPPHSTDAALIIELAKGAYTVEVVPLSTTGIGLIEVFEAPTTSSTPPTTPPTTRFAVDASNGTITDNTTGLMWQNAGLSHKERPDALNICANLSHAGYTNWRLPNMAESGVFHAQTNASGIVPTQLFDHCTAEVVSDGYVRTKKGAEQYGGSPGDPINFRGGANVRCVR
jgi:uncharacterized protein YkwD